MQMQSGVRQLSAIFQCASHSLDRHHDRESFLLICRRSLVYVVFESTSSVDYSITKKYKY